MTDQEILSHVDHTLLKPFASWEEIKKLCDEAVAHKTASVCVPPTYVKRISEAYGNNLVICTVIGFPLGYSTTAAKLMEAKTAIEEGTSEIDMVINITDVKNKRFVQIEDEITAIKKECSNHILKVIIETCYLTDEEKITLCGIVTDAGADYIKTSTGFGTGGALMADIELFKKHIGSSVKMKAAGGVKTREDLEAFINAGCDRIGTSSALALLAGSKSGAY
ncbi:MAG: deoxyribose-phosphate aldolase [Treponema sp.]|jgi:deoxyribose-phosphate aldolase|nr:deoxyribose-phosphate aldolase [Treponema sp.]